MPVLPDLSRRLGASPTMIGLLFGSFGATMLVVSVPMGAVSDRVGRRAPMLAGLIALARRRCCSRTRRTLPALFAARLVQGAADATTWVVGFALVADLYPPEERGRITGIMLGGTSVAYLVGPSIGGWLYEMGGIRLPFLVVTGMAVLTLIGFSVAATAATIARPESRFRLARCCAIHRSSRAVVVVLLMAATMTMFEPVFVLFLQDTLHISPARVGTVFAAAALANTCFIRSSVACPTAWGARRLVGIGMLAWSVALPLSGVRVELSTGRRAVRVAGGDLRARRRAVADVHGRSDHRSWSGVVRHRIRTVQRDLGGRPSWRGRPSAATSTSASAFRR